MTDAWTGIPAFGAVSHDATEATRQLLLQNPVFTYPSFQPIESVNVVSVTGASADVAETTTSLASVVTIPPNPAAVLYFCSVLATATGVGTILTVRHKPLGANAGAVSAQVLNVNNYAQIIAAPNSGRVTYTVTKNSATSFNYVIAVVGFFRSY